MRGRLRGCTIGTHSVKYEGTGSPHGSALLLPLETRLSRLRGWNRCDEDEERAARRGAWIFSRDLLPCRTDPRSTNERERARARSIGFDSATFCSLLQVELSRFERVSRCRGRGCIERNGYLGSFRRLQFDVFSRTPVAARSLSLTLEPYAGSTVTRTCTPRLIYERLAPF